VFALSETFHGDYPPREPGTGIFPGSVICEIADAQISSGSFRLGKDLLLMFQHGKEHAGIQGEYPVLPLGKPSAFTLRPGILPDRQEKPEMADAYCRNTYPETPLLPLQDGFFEIIRTGTPLVFSGEPSLPGVCYDNLPNTPFCICRTAKSDERYINGVFYRAVGGDYQSSRRASSISSIV